MSILNNEEGGIESNSFCRSVVVIIQEELCTLPKLSPPKKHCIYRVPKRLRSVREEAYTPVVVSIGPFHHNRKDERLLPMETLKLRFLHSFIQRSEKKGYGDLNTYIEMIKDKERQIRDSYAEQFPMSSEEFVRMVLVDSAFIIGLIRFKWHINIMPAVNYAHVYHDLRLAENQLPFFILVQLYRTAFPPTRPDDPRTFSNSSFTEVACKYFGVDKSKVEVDTTTNEATKWYHLLDLLRTHYLPSHLDTNTTERKERDTWEVLFPTAMSLREAGVKFSVSKEKPCSLLDIQFNKRKGILTIPSLHVDDNTETYFRNMIAFEQSHCYPKQTTYIADYFFFMDCLINTREDVSLLSRAGIIDNWLGSEEEVAHLINSLSTHVLTTPSVYHYATIAEELNIHRNKRWNRNRATLIHTYFKHPWASMSVIYALFLMLLTIAQLLTGILAVPGLKK